MRTTAGSISLLFALPLVAAAAGYACDAKAVGEDKAGPLMGNFKIAPALSFGNDFGFRGCDRFGCFSATQFAMEFEIAYAVDHDNNAYIGFNPQFEFGWGTIINLTGTFQYDIQIAKSKVKGLYIYPKINVGIAVYPNTFGNRICGFGNCSGASAAFTLQPEVGVKFNIFKNFHVLGEPLSFPIYIGDFTFAQWRFWLGCGFDV
jgi:hypothetical protein